MEQNVKELDLHKWRRVCIVFYIDLMLQHIFLKVCHTFKPVQINTVMNVKQI